MNMRPEIIISLAAVLLASQVAVIIALVVLCKRFKTLKDEVNRYKIKKNRKSLPSLVIKDPKEKSTNRPSNEYVDGKRHPSTLAKTNSKESIVYVPTPDSDRRSKNLDENGYELDVMQGIGDPSTFYNEGANDQEDEIYGNQVVIDIVEKGVKAEQAHSTTVDSIANNNKNPSTPCIEEININPGYTQDTDEIYGNQFVIDMAENQAASSVSDVQMNTSNVNTRKGPKSKKSNKTKNKKLNTSIESGRTVEEGESYYEGGNTDVKNEPIYENLRGQIASTNA